MHNRFLSAALTLAALLPMLALAQPLAAQREGSWEFSVGGGAAFIDGDLASYLGSKGFTADSTEPGHVVPAVALRLGYNVNNGLGFSIGTGGATGSGVKYLTPFAAVTYTANLSARTAPFVTLGTQFTRVTGENNRVTHPTWGAHLGLGIRSMVAERVAVRLEGRTALEHYAELPGKKTAYNSIVTLGLSFFTGGRAYQPCMCPRARVDTLWWAPAPIKLRDTLVLEGVNFDFDSSALTRESYRVLDRVARELLKPDWANSRWEIAGHTSSIATAEYNMALSQRRAESVRAYLVSRGVANDRLVPKGYGEANPMYPNDSEGRNWRNRRVELRRIRP